MTAKTPFPKNQSGDPVTPKSVWKDTIFVILRIKKSPEKKQRRQNRDILIAFPL
jgi:hypothetical protein